MMLATCGRLLGLGLLALSSGCAMCSSCDDYSYSAYGGAWERLDRTSGRVGSAFTPEVGTRVLVDGTGAPRVPGELEVVPEGEAPAEPQPVPPQAPADAAEPVADDTPPAPPRVQAQQHGGGSSILRRTARQR